MLPDEYNILDTLQCIRIALESIVYIRYVISLHYGAIRIQYYSMLFHEILNTTPHYTTSYDMIQQYYMALSYYDVLLYSAIPYYTIPRNANAMLCYAMPCHAMPS